MNWTAKYQARRNRYWPEVELFFSNLRAQLFRQGVLLKNNLAIAFSDSGQFNDVLARAHDYPLLYLHFWLLDDFQFPDTSERGCIPDVPAPPSLLGRCRKFAQTRGDSGGYPPRPPRFPKFWDAPAERTQLDKHLFLAMTFTFAAVYTAENILDEGSSFDNEYLLLAQALSRQADFHLHQLYPGQARFWEYHQAFWQEYSEAVLAAAARRPPPADNFPSLAEFETAAELRQISSQLALAKIPVAAVALSAGQEARLPQLLGLMDRFNLIFQILRDISTLRRDLRQRKYTYPIIRTMHAAGIEPHHSVNPERILGAVVLTGSINKICEELLEQLQTCRHRAAVLQLPTFAAYFTNVEDLITQVMALFSLKPRPKAQQETSPKFSFTPYIDPLPNAVELAEQYLLSDLTFREAWDVQRGGLLNGSELVAKAFPGGLITEVLCQNGHDLSEQVAEIFQTLQKSGFRYYDDSRLPPDADDLGLLLRLYRYSAPVQRESHQKMLQAPLHWMAESILPSGEIPVWFKPKDSADEEIQTSILVWGNSCATSETNLLLGLIDFNWDRYRQVVEKSTLSVLERLRINGLGATLYYLPPYILWVTFQLFAHLSNRPIQAPLRDELNRAVEILLKRLEFETQRPVITPQEAAFLTLSCCSFPPVKHLFDDRWLTILLKSQRPDGGWDDEPLFLIPDWRGTAWYASRSVTTAFCYHALKTYQQSS